MRSCRRVVVIVVMAMAVFAVTSAESSAWTSPVNVSGTTFTDRAPDAGIAGDQTATVVWQRDGFPYPLIQLRTRMCGATQNTMPLLSRNPTSSSSDLRMG